MRSRARGGFTLIEAIIVIVILLLVLTIALPAIHRARETSRRAQCKANLKTLGIALYNYETAYRRFPSGGKGTAWTASPSLMASPDVNPVLIPNGTAFDPQSTFTAILPYLGEFPSHKAASGDLPYNTDRETPPGRRTRAQASIAWEGFRCPSNPIGYRDPAGYGQTDFAPTAFVDIALSVSNARGSAPSGTWDPATPTDRRSRHDGLLALGGTPIGLVTDGTSDTIAIIESVGRQFAIGSSSVTSPHLSPGQTRDACAAADGSSPSGYRCPNRWADPDNALGLSGPPGGKSRLIKNHFDPIGGPPECPWTTENCGPNDEPFGFHTGGVQAVFADGAARFLSENIHNAVLARLVARADGEQVGFPGCDSSRRSFEREDRRHE